MTAGTGPELAAVEAGAPEARGATGAGERYVYPASFAQSRLWLLDRLAPGSSLYNVARAFHIEGRLDRRALARALQGVVDRHETLRTTFEEADDGPLQVIAAARVHSLPVVDLAGLPEERRQGAAEALAREEAARPFDLERGPLLRTPLLDLGPRGGGDSGEGRHLLLLTLHHVVSDAWSAGVLMSDLVALYGAAREGRPSPLPELAIQYADFSVWQREWLQGEELERQVGYWRRTLDGAPPLLKLPTDRPRPPVQSFRGAHLPFGLDPELSVALREAGHRASASPFMVLLTAFSALLGRWAGEDDLVVGVPVSGRTEPETEPLVGFFVNTLVVRADLSGRPGFAELLDRVREAVLGAREHQDLPFERLVEELAPERSLSHAPLSQVTLNMVEAPPTPARGGQPTIRPVRVEHRVAKFDLTLAVTDAGDRFGGILEYDVALFDDTTVRRLVDQLLRLLRAGLACPRLPVGRLPLLSPGARHQLLVEWQGPWAPPVEDSVVAAFGRRVAETPDAVSLRWTGGAMTFRALDARAERLAARLRRAGAGRGSRVGLFLDRSPEMVAAVWAVLGAGAAYVPLDPAAPMGRTAFRIEDAGVAVVVTRSTLRSRLPDAGVKVVEVDAAASEPRAVSDRHRPGEPAAWTSELDPADLAYVLYTSGSTGRPKGVQVSHGALASYLLGWAVPAYRVAAGPGGPLHTALGFDLTVTSLFAPLLAGRPVTLLPEGAEVDALAAALAAPLADAPAEPGRAGEPPGLVKLTPGHLEALDDLLGRPDGGAPADGEAPAGRSDGDQAPAAGPSAPTSTLVVGGEALPSAAAAAWLRRDPRSRIVNEYGPTEATVGCSVHEVTAQEAGGGTVPIGRPITNARILLLDSSLEPVLPGAVGELSIGGPGLARGYLGRPALTAERFVPDPSGGPPGARLYRSGDLARWRTDGVLLFEGRLDHQVKIRGFRVEPGEVEAVLGRRTEVRECVVVARSAGPGDGDRHLVAYVVGPADPSELRSWLADRLPGYMVPASVVTLDALPRTAHGKVDRRALPAPEEPAGGRRQGDTVAVTEEEELLAAIWSRVLGVEEVGRRDDFFALGGHSLLATRVLARVRETLGVVLPLSAMFRSPTLAGLAREVRAARRRAAADGTGDAPPLEPRERGGPAPVSFAQRRFWFLDRLEPGSAAYTVPLALRLEGDLDVRSLARACGEIVRRHEVLRTRFEPGEESEPLQVVEPPGRTSLGLVDLGGLPERLRAAEARARGRTFVRRSFDLERELPVRWGLVRLAPGRHVLLIGLHHIAADGASVGLLLDELAILYRWLAGGGAPAARGAGAPGLPELPLQYADFAAWQRRWLTGRALDARLAPWRRELEGMPHILSLPTDRPRPAVRGDGAAERALDWPEELAARLRALARETGTTLFMVVLAALQELLRRYAGSDDFAVGTPVSGRDRVALERLVGCFVNTLVLRARLAGRPTVRELLERTRETVLRAHAHADVPFEVLVEDLAPVRSLAHTPLFQVMLTLWRGGPDRTALPDLPGLAVSPVGGIGGGGAKADLFLGLSEDGGRLVGGLQYATDLFDATTAARMARHLEILAGGFAADPEAPVDRLPMLAPAEIQQLVRELSDTAGGPVPDRTLPELLRAQAVRTPDRVALVSPDRSPRGEESAGAGGSRVWTYGGLHRRSRVWTYGGLHRRALAVAEALRRAGVGPEVRVEVCLDRGPDLVVVLLGVLYAGGAYVPLDPTYPASRLAAISARSGAGLRVTCRGLAGVDAAPGRRLVLVEDLPERAAGTPGPDGPDGPGDGFRRHAGSVVPQNLAYVIFSSGSTGVPKGVAIEHRSACALVGWAADRYSGEELEGTLAATSVCFDLSVFELFAPLATGGTVFLARDALELPELPAADRIRLVNTVPSAVNELLALGPLPPAVGTVNLAGEVLEGALVDRLAATGVDRIFNLYGPSEDTTYTTEAAVGGPRAGEPTIGRPLRDTCVHLLDRGLRPVPRGVYGELCIAGAGSARGYLGRPAETAERWVPDPFAVAPGGRLYRTGDLARFRPDGEIELLGRLDHQVKVRGFRIELGDVESAFASHPTVGEAAAVVVGERVADRRLEAFVTPRGDDVPVPATLRRHLAERLPAFMVPSTVRVLDRLPLTPNGKVDRRILAERAARGDGAGDGERPGRAPRDAVELLVVGVFSEVLGRPEVGLDDDFFELGGHSLLAVRLVAAVRRRFGRELPLSVLFRHPTPADLADLLRGGSAPGRRSPLVVLRTPGPDERTPLVLVHPVGGNVVCYRHLAEHLGRRRPVWALESPGLQDGVEQPATVEELAAVYLRAVAEAWPGDELLLGGWSGGGVVAYEMARQAARGGRRVAHLALIDSFAPADVPAHDDGEILLLHGWRLGVPLTELGPLSTAERFRRLVDELRRRDLIPGDGGAREVERLLRVYRTNLDALVTYRPEPYDGPAVLFRSTRPEDYGEYGALFGRGVADPLPGWRRLIAGPLAVRDVAATHDRLIAEPCVASLAAELEGVLASPAAAAATPVGDLKGALSP